MTASINDHRKNKKKTLVIHGGLLFLIHEHIKTLLSPSTRVLEGDSEFEEEDHVSLSHAKE